MTGELKLGYEARSTPLADEVLNPCMSLQVIIQGTVMSKSPLALGAFVRKFVCVEEKVSCETPFSRERFPTGLATKGFFSCMSSHVIH